MTTDHGFYTDVYKGTYEADIIEPCLKAADLQIGCAVIKEDLGEREEYFLKYAACIQAEDIAEKNGYSNSSAVIGNASRSAADSFTSLKLGDFSISRNASSASGSSAGESSLSGGKGELCERAAAYLERNGLLYRGGIKL